MDRMFIPPPNSYVKALILKVKVVGGEASMRKVGSEEVTRVRVSSWG